MALQSEEIAHKDLTSGSKTELHSHLDIKAGVITTDGSGVGAVVFGTAYSDANYVILLTAQNSGDATICVYSSKAVGGFDVATLDDEGNAEPNVIVDWITKPYSNP